MRGHWAHRSIAGLIAGLFLLLTVGMGEASHVCPVHDPMLAQAMASGGAHHAGEHAALGAHEQWRSGCRMATTSRDTTARTAVALDSRA